MFSNLSKNPLWRLVLPEPAVALTEPERRRRHILVWTQSTLILLVSVALVMVLLFNNENSPRRELYTILIAGVLALLLAAFALNRQGRYTASAVVTIVCAFLGPWGSLFGDATIMQGDFVPLTFLVLSVILAGILLPVRATVLLAVIQFGLLLLMPRFVPATAGIDWPSFMAFFLFASILGAVSNFINRQDLKQIDEQTRLLLESEARLRELSMRDPLTGLFNRRYMEETLDRELRRAERKGLPLGIIMIDLDHLKGLNDTYGHAAGDEVLHQLGILLGTQIRGSDIVCRFGGDEFVMILPEASLKVTLERAEGLRLEAKELTVLFGGLTVEVITLSIGVAVFPNHGTTRLPLLAAVDAAMYRAKREGRNRVAAAEDVKQGP